MMGEVAGTTSRAANPKEPVCRCFVIDGGAGAPVAVTLYGADPRLEVCADVRDADVLVIVEPVTRKLARVIVEATRGLASPEDVIIVGAPGPAQLPGADVITLEDYVPGARRLAAGPAEVLVEAALDLRPSEGWTAEGDPSSDALGSMRPLGHGHGGDDVLMRAVGPLQPLTAGPLRLVLGCAGDQVRFARVDAGWAHRGIVPAMLKKDWEGAAALAGALDPLAPLAGRLAWVEALEKLQGGAAPASLVAGRRAALALERAWNHVEWLARFARVLGASFLAARARGIAHELLGSVAELWPRPATEWIAPRHGNAPVAAKIGTLRWIRDDLAACAADVAHDQLLGRATRGIGVIPPAVLTSVGASGPVLAASERGAGDAAARLNARLAAAVRDLDEAAEALPQARTESGPGKWTAPAGTAIVEVAGPRGTLGLKMVSHGGPGPARVEWRAPSSALIAALPAILAGRPVGDVELILASLDLSMAEADG